MKKRKISFKIGKALKAAVVKQQHIDQVQYYNEFVLSTIMFYIHEKKYLNMEVFRSEILIDNSSPTSVELSEEQEKRINQALEETNRNLNSFIAMVLTDFIKKKAKI